MRLFSLFVAVSVLLLFSGVSFDVFGNSTPPSEQTQVEPTATITRPSATGIVDNFSQRQPGLIGPRCAEHFQYTPLDTDDSFCIWVSGRETEYYDYISDSTIALTGQGYICRLTDEYPSGNSCPQGMNITRQATSYFCYSSTAMTPGICIQGYSPGRVWSSPEGPNNPDLRYTNGYECKRTDTICLEDSFQIGADIDACCMYKK